MWSFFAFFFFFIFFFFLLRLSLKVFRYESNIEQRKGPSSPLVVMPTFPSITTFFSQFPKHSPDDATMSLNCCLYRPESLHDCGSVIGSRLPPPTLLSLFVTRHNPSPGCASSPNLLAPTCLRPLSHYFLPLLSFLHTGPSRRASDLISSGFQSTPPPSDSIF